MKTAITQHAQEATEPAAFAVTVKLAYATVGNMHRGPRPRMHRRPRPGPRPRPSRAEGRVMFVYGFFKGIVARACLANR